MNKKIEEKKKLLAKLKKEMEEQIELNKLNAEIQKITSELKPNKEPKDTTAKRMGRGLKVMGSGLKKAYVGLANSEFVKNQQAMQEADNKGELPSMLPEGLIESTKKNKEEDVFSTKL